MPSRKMFLAIFAISLLTVSMTSVHASEKVEKKEWALLTFLNGFNNLDSFGYRDMNEMEKIGSTDRVHVVSQWASLKTKDVRRVYVQKDSNPTSVTSPVVENIGRADMGDYRTLIEFIKWAAKKYPAKHYFVNVWNHGNGWHRFNGGLSTRDVSYDDLSGNKITTEQLGQALAEASREIGQKIDIFGSDSCLMAMAEVVGQMNGHVTTFVGSEEVEPADGWPYDTFLSKWNEGGEKSSNEVAEILTETYAASYSTSRDVTLSGLDVTKYPVLVNAVRDLAEAIKSLSVSERTRVHAAAGSAHSYTNSDYRDLGDLVDEISKDSSISIRSEILLRVKESIKEFVVANKTSSDQVRSHGVSIWFPNSTWQFNSYRDRYLGLVFNRDTAWLDAISSTLSASNL
jgi:hypothetical protein